MGFYTLLHPCQIENFFGNAGQAVCVLAHDAAKLLGAWLADEVFGQQCIGLRNRSQRVAYLMGHGSRHTAHGC